MPIACSGRAPRSWRTWPGPRRRAIGTGCRIGWSPPSAAGTGWALHTIPRRSCRSPHSPAVGRPPICVQRRRGAWRLPTAAAADRMLWPRAGIREDMAWSNAPRDWNGLSDRLVSAFGRWHELGLAYDTTPLVPLATFTGRGDRIDVTLNQPAGMGTIRVTEDGSAPTPASPAYTAPMTLASGTTLRAQSFLGEAALGDEIGRASGRDKACRTVATRVVPAHLQ